LIFVEIVENQIPIITCEKNKIVLNIGLLLGVIKLINAPLDSLMDSTVNPKVKTMEGKEVGFVLWLVALWGQGGMLELRDGD
jgi:hypothetical protein